MSGAHGRWIAGAFGIWLGGMAWLACGAGEPVTVPAPDAAGGGWADGGPLGAYFANPDLAGEPAFSRREVRVVFDWGAHLPVGGSPAEPYRSFPRDGFSVRWTGRVVPRFSEAYTFAVRAAGGVRLKLKPAGAADWTAALDTWEKSGGGSALPMALAAGKPCDVVLEYRHAAGPAAVELRWACPSAAEEVVDHVVAQGLNASSWVDYCWANTAKYGGYAKAGQAMDAHGFPTSDASAYFLGNGAEGANGTYALVFSGKAEVDGRGLTFAAGGKTWKDTLPRGAGWDAADNTTRAGVSNSATTGGIRLEFKQTARDGGEPRNDGSADVRLMRPLRPGADAAHHPDEIVYRPFRDAVAPYTCLRWLQIANQRTDADWNKRTRPAWATFTRGGFWSDNSGGECWEMLIVLANECGKDLYLCLPMQADDAYVEKMARLVRYGSDGVEPYDREVDQPRWPPLNPNLRLYVEIGNEIWNWGFGSTQYCQERAQKEIKDGTADGKLIDYDGHGDYRRWHALRTVRASDVFRKVSGDAAMGPRIRMLLEYQYNNAQNTAEGSFAFLDNWFNNGDGDHVAAPHSARYWVWGGGGATYYGVGNSDGRQEAVRLSDPGFEAGSVADGCATNAPAGSGWTFSGAAGVYRNDRVSVEAFTPGKPGQVAKSAAAGCTLRVERPLFLRSLGCWLRPRAPAHDVILLGPQGVVAQAKVQVQRIAVFDVEGWCWAPVRGAPPRLDPGVDYHLLARAEKGAPVLFDAPVPVTAGPGFKIVGAARVPAGAGADPQAWQVQAADAGALAYGPVAVRATSAAETPSTGLPDPPVGGQAAVLRAGGVLSTKVNFPKAGRYALELHAAGSGKNWPGYLAFNATVGGKSADPRGQRDERYGTTFGMGGFHRRIENPCEVWGSAVFEVDPPGECELRLAAAAKGEGWTVFDDIRIASVEALLDSGFGAGQAYGQVAQDNYAKQLDGQASYARSFGLPVIAYEAGWSLGGDFHAKPIQTWCKYKEERARGINDTAADIFMRSGGFMDVWGVYTYWPEHDIVNAASYPLVRSVAGLAGRLPAAVDNGIAAPGRLTSTNIVHWAWNDGSFKGEFGARGQWRSWLILTPSAGVWSFAVHAKGDGAWELEVDGVPVGQSVKAGEEAARPCAVRLVTGQHGVRLRNRGGAFTLEAIEVAPVKGP